MEILRNASVHFPSARRILDFGCGTGWLIAAAKTEGDACRVGVDRSLTALQNAKAHKCIRLVAADGVQLPFRDNAFDVVIGNVSMPYMATTDALREIYRVLVPGGYFFLTFHSFCYLRRRLLRSLRKMWWRDVLFMMYAAANGLLNHWSMPQMRAWWKPNLFETVNTPSGVSKTARKLGFVLISTENCAEQIAFETTAQKPHMPFSLSTPG